MCLGNSQIKIARMDVRDPDSRGILDVLHQKTILVTIQITELEKCRGSQSHQGSLKAHFTTLKVGRQNRHCQLCDVKTVVAGKQIRPSRLFAVRAGMQSRRWLLYGVSIRGRRL
mmetsp:Transcript_31590/g.66103  ORF Transcript_31590/g.66103 Transcript_31590/m.66103 type:complete len:114 (-) Transcript_31590:424-765(-)